VISRSYGELGRALLSHPVTVARSVQMK